MHRLIGTSRASRRHGCCWIGLGGTRQAAPFLPHCSDIVAIGRVKWIEGSKHTGKDNHAWYRFDARHSGGPVFHRTRPERGDPFTAPGVCEQCGKAYEPQRSSSRFCSATCRQRAHRKRLSVTPSVTARAIGLPRKCFATSDTLTFRGSRRKAGSRCLHSMAHTTVSTRC